MRWSNPTRRRRRGPGRRAAPRAAAASPPRCGAGSWSARARSGSVRRRRRASGPGGAGTPHVALRGTRRVTGSMGPLNHPGRGAGLRLLTRPKHPRRGSATHGDDSGPMFFRVRTSLTERPGALALLATRCGEAGLNIMGLQIFPDLGSVTDELVISAARGLDRACGRRAREWCRRGRGERRTLHHSRPDRPAGAMADRRAGRGGGSRAAAGPAGEAARTSPGEVECCRALAGRVPARARGVGRRPAGRARPRPGGVRRDGERRRRADRRPRGRSRRVRADQRSRADHRGRAGLAAARDRHQPAHPGGRRRRPPREWTRSCCSPRPRTRVSWRWCPVPGCGPGSR